MKDPIILSQKQTEVQVELMLEIPDSVIFFEGHFPKHPLLPGVVQIHWAQMLGKRFFPQLGQFNRLENIKFQAIITPNSQVTLDLTYQPQKQKLLFVYHTDDVKHSSGRILLDR